MVTDGGDAALAAVLAEIRGEGAAGAPSTATPTEGKPEPGATITAPPDDDLDDDEGGAVEPPAGPSADEDDEPEDEPEEEDEEVRAARQAEEQGRQLVKRALRNSERTLRRALAGHQGAIDALNPEESRLFNLLKRAQQQGQEQGATLYRRQQQAEERQRSYQLYDSYLTLRVTDPDRFQDEIDTKPSVAAWWRQFEALKRDLGLPAHASAEQIEAKRRIAAGEVETATGSQQQAADPEQLFDALADEDGAELLTDEDWAALEPERFRTDGADDLAVMRRMAARFGRLVRDREVRNRPTNRRAREEADQAQRAARQVGPGAALPGGNEAPRRRSQDDLIDQFLRESESGRASDRTRKATRELLRTQYGITV